MNQESQVVAHPESHPFVTVHRLRLLKLIMQGRGEGCCGLDLRTLQLRGSLLAHFPLHERDELVHLAASWLSLDVMPWEQVGYIIDSTSA